MNDAPADVLRQVIVRYGTQVCDDPRRVEGLLRDLAGQHRREVAVLAGAVREGVPAALLASRDGTPFAVLGQRLAQLLQDNLGLAGDAARWAVSTWAAALGMKDLDLPAQTRDQREDAMPTVQAVPPQALGHVTRLLDGAIDSATLIESTGFKARELARVASVLAAIDPGRAGRLFDDAERLARSVSNDDIVQWIGCGGVAQALARADPERAVRLAESIQDHFFRTRAFEDLAEMLAATAPAWQRRLLDKIEVVAASMPTDSSRSLVQVNLTEALVRGDPDRALRVARSVADVSHKAMALSTVARSLALSDPVRSARLFNEAEDLAQSSLRPDSDNDLGGALAHVAGNLADIDMDRAVRIAREVSSMRYETSQRFAAGALTKIAKKAVFSNPGLAEALIESIEGAPEKSRARADLATTVAAADPDHAERLIGLIGDASTKDQALANVAKRLADADLHRAVRLARAMTDGHSKASVLAAVANTIARAEPDRAADLFDEAERVALAVTEPDARSIALCSLAAELAKQAPRTEAALPTRKRTERHAVNGAAGEQGGCDRELVEDLIMTGDPAGRPTATSPLHFICIIDASSLMADRIQALNFAIRELLPAMQDMAGEHPSVRLLMRAVTFSSGARWHLEEPTEVARVSWRDVHASGDSDLGAALSLVADALRVPPMADRGLPPVLVLLSGSQITDDYHSALGELLAQKWGRAAVRLGIRVGRGADLDALTAFMDDPAIAPLQANNAASLLSYIRWTDSPNDPEW